jgi:hypothetical protein
MVSAWLFTLRMAAVAFVAASAPSDPAPSRLGEVEACLRTCEAHDDATDRATCRLQCEEKVHAKDEPNIIRWKRTETIRGGFDGEAPRKEQTTTTTTSTPRGPSKTTTTSTKPPAASPVRPPSPSPIRSRRDALAGCQAQCDRVVADDARAQCKLKCLRDPYGSLTAGKPSPPVVGAPPGGTPRPVSKPTAVVESKGSTEAAACRSGCGQRADGCRDGCVGQGADRSTCELQCDQIASRCHDDCKGS